MFPGWNFFRDWISRRGSLPALVLSTLCFSASLLIRWLIAHYIVGHPVAADRPVIFWQTLHFQHLFFGYAGIGFLLFAAAQRFIPLERWSPRLLVLLVMVAATAARWATPDLAVDLGPKPDAFHYGALASRVKDWNWTIPVGPHNVPPRFSPGTSIVAALTQWTNPGHAGAGVTAIWLSGIACLWLVWKTGVRLFSHRVGIIAALLLILSPAYAYYSRIVMSEIPWSLFILAAVAVPFLYGGARSYFAGGFLLALGMFFKPPHVAVLAGLGLVQGVWFLAAPRQRWTLVLASGAGVMAGLAPVLLFNQAVNGSWHVFGYNTHDSNAYAAAQIFGLRYLFGPPIDKGFTGNLIYYPAALLGLDMRISRMLFVLPLGLLVALASWPLLRQAPAIRAAVAQIPHNQRWFLFSALGVLAVFTGLFLIYYYQDTRFLLPIFPLLCLVCAMLVDPVLKTLREREEAWLLGAILAAVLASAAATVHVETRYDRPSRHEALQVLPGLMENYDVLLTDEDAVLLGHYSVWTDTKPMIPILSAGSDWYGPDPVARRASTGTFQEVFPGMAGLLEEPLRAGKKIAVYVVYPRSSMPLLKREFPDYMFQSPGSSVPAGFLEMKAVNVK